MECSALSSSTKAQAGSDADSSISAKIAEAGFSLAPEALSGLDAAAAAGRGRVCFPAKLSKPPTRPQAGQFATASLRNRLDNLLLGS